MLKIFILFIPLILWNCQNNHFGQWSNNHNWFPQIVPSINDNVMILNNTNCLPWIDNNVTINNLYLYNIGGIVIDVTTMTINNLYLTGSISMWNSSLVINGKFIGNNYAIIMNGIIIVNEMEINNNSYIEIIGNSTLETVLTNRGLMMINRGNMLHVNELINYGNIYMELPGSSISSYQFFMNGSLTLDIKKPFKQKIIEFDKFDNVIMNIFVVQPDMEVRVIIGDRWIEVYTI